MKERAPIAQLHAFLDGKTGTPKVGLSVGHMPMALQTLPTINHVTLMLF